eukprot:TRINITY_DN635_c0_g2_i2.p1 TRINITY_DN635_c0_g2~~TRINITY_DN635_c0_g2_i2.p1  ORF type:complete len:309 (+),score=92.35 TRINITY_DN635_c0_g2_i2:28-927(+)
MTNAFAEELKLFKDPGALLNQGAFLSPATQRNGESVINVSKELGWQAGGKVIFSLQELPLSFSVATEHENILRRISPTEVAFSSKDGRSTVLIPIPQEQRTLSSIPPKVRDDLELFGNPKVLMEKGGLVLDMANGGVGKVVFCLTDLPLNQVFLTERQNQIHRISNKEVDLEGVTIQIEEEEKGKVDFAFVETVQFEVVQLKKDNAQQKRIILLNLHKLKIKDKNGKRTFAKDRYGSFDARADLINGNLFTIEVKRKNYHFAAPSQALRDQMLNTINAFSKRSASNAAASSSSSSTSTI